MLRANYLIFSISFLCLSLLASGQRTEVKSYCGFDKQHNHLIQNDEKYRKSTNDIETRWISYERKRSGRYKSLYTLPVVVHIIHNNGTENIQDAEVLQGIENLNDAFANRGYYNPNVGIDAEIEFCLAKQDPQGRPTSGINRITSAYTEFNYSTEENLVKDLSRWDPTKYINIWVVREICSSSGCGVAGYAYFPSAHGSGLDGIVVESEYFGSAPSFSAVLVHEMGHYLGLYHTFQGGCGNNDCRADGDRICDTPPDNTTVRTACASSINSCETDADDSSLENPYRAISLGGIGDQDDQFHNYMDYSRLECYDQFTLGQKDRMLFTIDMIRNSLLSSKGCQDPCSNPITIDFIANQTDIMVGETVEFTNLSSGANDYNWYLNGQVFSNDFNSSYTFDSEGIFTIVLEGTNDDPNCYSDYDTVFIRVVCPVEAGFSYEQTGDLEITVTDESINADAIEYEVYDRWGSLLYQGTDPQFILSVTEPGIYLLYLVARNSVCEDRKAIQINIIDKNTCDSGGRAIVFNETNNTVRPKLLSSSGGGFYSVYLHLDEIVVRYLDADMNILWAKTITVFPNNVGSRILGLLHEDTEGKLLIGVRMARGGNSILCKYDPFNHSIDWIRNLRGSGLVLYSAHEFYPGEYLFTGQINECNEAFALRVRKVDGFSIEQIAFRLSNCTSFFSSYILGTDLYLCGRYGIDAATGFFRGCITKIDLVNFDVSWSRHYLEDGLDPARQYFRNIKVFNNELFCVGYGVKDGTNTANFTGLLFKSDLNGNPIKALEVRPENSRQAWLTEIIEFNGKFYGFGQFLNTITGNSEIYIVEFTLAGDIERTFGINLGTEDHGIWFNENQIFVNGDYFVFGGNYGNSAFILKLNLQDLNDNDCINIRELDADVYEYQNPYVDNHSLSKRSSNTSFEEVNVNINEPSTELDRRCFESLPDLSIQIKEDTICIPYSDYGYIEVTWCLENGELNGTPIFGPLLNGDPFGSAIESVETLFFQHLDLGDTCLTEVVGVTSDGNPYGFWHYLIMNYNENHGSNDWLDGFPFDQQEECNYQNNIDSFFVRVSPPPPNLGPDIEICDNEIFNFEIENLYESIRWSDGSVDTMYTAYEEGLHWVEVSDVCGNVYRDSVWIIYDPISQVDLGSDLQVCGGEQIELETNVSFTNYQWFPLDQLNCSDCRSVIVDVDSSVTVTVTVDNGNGCYSSDSIRIEILSDISIEESESACQGDTVIFGGIALTEEGLYRDTISIADGCDTFFILDLRFHPTYGFNLEEEICTGDSVLIGSNWIYESGVYQNVYESVEGCDSVVVVDIQVLDRDSSTLDRNLCEGDSILFGGNWIYEAGEYAYTGQNQFCDSIYLLNLKQLDTSVTELSFELCEGDSIWIAQEWINDPGFYSFLTTNEAGCDSLISVNITPVNLGSNPSIEIDCDALEVLASMSIDDGLNIEWSNGDTLNQTSYAEGDSAWVLVFQDASCGRRYDFSIPRLPDLDSAPAWEDSIAYSGEPFIIDLGLDPADWRVEWSASVYFSCDTCMVTRLIYTEDVQIELTLTHRSGCSFTYFFNIEWRDQEDLYIPNSFSPNGDNNNDIWEVYYKDHVELFLEGALFSRWGSEIRRWENTREIKWDGTFNGEDMNPSVFAYYLKYRTSDGATHLVKGDVTLMR